MSHEKIRFPIYLTSESIEYLAKTLNIDKEKLIKACKMAEEQLINLYLYSNLSTPLVMPPEICPPYLEDGKCIVCGKFYREHRYWFWFANQAHVNTVYNLLNGLQARHDALQNQVFVMKEQIDPELMPTVKDLFNLLDKYITNYTERSPVYIALWFMISNYLTAAGHYQYLHYFLAGIPLQQCKLEYRNFQVYISHEKDLHNSIEDFEIAHEESCKKMYEKIRHEIHDVENVVVGLEELLKRWQETHEMGFGEVMRVAMKKGWEHE